MPRTDFSRDSHRILTTAIAAAALLFGIVAVHGQVRTAPRISDPAKFGGLGLSTVYGIVKQHHGHISVQSEVGKGTSFRILFPEVDAPAEVEAKRQTRPKARGSETILIVEDEDIVRRVATQVLDKCGYRILTAASAEQALELARHSSEAKIGRAHV